MGDNIPTYKDLETRLFQAQKTIDAVREVKVDALIGKDGVYLLRLKKAEDKLRVSEERLRFALEISRTGAWELDLEGNTTYRSLEHDRLFGYSELLPQWTHEMFLDHVLPEDREAVDAKIRTAMENKSDWSFECRIRRIDGNTRWVWASGRHLTDAAGQVNRIAGALQDITERKDIEQELLFLNESLEQRVANRTRQLQSLAIELIEAEERERRRIAQLLHDDLQQTLASARLQLQVACDDFAAGPLLNNVNELLEQSIKKTRDLSQQLSPSVLHHAGLLGGLQWLCGRMKAQFGLQVQLETLTELNFDDAPLCSFLYRSAQEMLFNVTKHAGVQNASVTLTADNGNIAIAVSDHGNGFEPEINCSPENAGFGLLTIKERANRVGGSLIIESSPGKGSRFTLTVPFLDRKGESQQKASMPEPQPQNPISKSEYKKKTVLRVLFADDHKVIRQGLIQLIANKPDIQVVGEAADGLAAVQLARQVKPDLVLMDVSMPNMDGIEATRRIKAELPQTRVISLSMHEDEHIVSAMLQAGAEVALCKTASAAELLKAIYGFAEKSESPSKLNQSVSVL